MGLLLINQSQWSDDYLRQTIEWIMADLKIEHEISFLFQTIWTDLDEDGEPINGTEQDLSFDGDSYPHNGRVRVAISEQMNYDHVWDINSQLPGEYLRKVAVFKDKYEFFIYFAAHELRHQKQFANPRWIKAVCKHLECDAEFDADMYAIRVLSKFRCAETIR